MVSGNFIEIVLLNSLSKSRLIEANNILNVFNFLLIIKELELIIEKASATGGFHLFNNFSYLMTKMKWSN